MCLDPNGCELWYEIRGVAPFMSGEMIFAYERYSFGFGIYHTPHLNEKMGIGNLKYPLHDPLSVPAYRW